ncbi:INO1 [Cyberlindnera jadinii]|uniref:Inositol-3-phosphate synthase n=1 Tax=Cyberlindnera jadinii (strain ATCC 18201 / CBS 1600 / BCRC 20928 / JCM 3617 / NBRC 0987 / NRRL Y-1542) TaxID=983966 RepID=A0A0H5C9Z4_CYBJN|nr:Myo-inositol-1-phosphate synthase [Cyberlindnera jadinii NRRL Y-1542]ODV71539.1 Myo-inositol-1-phosphate synthase [Cyberlindnera jadinii NRRL Y-1542]CEP25255.1 INO1 [Cyberlindnera jadinii]
MVSIKVNNDSVKYSEDNSKLSTTYTYKNSIVKESEPGVFTVSPFTKDYEFDVNLKVPKVGLLLVGLGGNNGSTFVSAVEANKQKITFNTKDGEVKANYFGSVTQSSTVKIGIDETGRDVYVPFSSILPLVNPSDLIVSGWDISGYDLEKAAKRAKVLEYDLQQKLGPTLKNYKPLKSIYYPSFIAANQEERADNIFNVDANGNIDQKSKWAHVEQIRSDIKNFKESNKLDSVIVLWTANTERYSKLLDGVNDTSANLLKSIKEGHAEVSPSTVFAVASILEKVPFINGSPQNTFVPGVVELAEEYKSFIGGDDFKSGQTKMKSVLAQFLVDAGIKPVSIASYNHLGNNDGYNLSSNEQFRSKEISKGSVIDDIVESNSILYNKELGDKVDHCIVIKYIPAVGDSKIAMDEYYSELMLGGHNRISISNVCEDSLLATPLIIDLVVMTEFLSRVSYKEASSSEEQPLYPILGYLSYWLKAPLTRKGFQTINGLNKQKQGLENFLKVLVGIPISDELRFEERL